MFLLYVFVQFWHPFWPVHEHVHSLCFDSVLVSIAVQFMFALSCIRAWQSLASVDITVSVDPADSIAAFELEKIRAFSNLFWCKFSRRCAVRMASIQFLHQRQSNVVPVAYSRKRVHIKCQHQRLCIRPFESHL